MSPVAEISDQARGPRKLEVAGRDPEAPLAHDVEVVAPQRHHVEAADERGPGVQPVQRGGMQLGSEALSPQLGIEVYGVELPGVLVDL